MKKVRKLRNDEYFYFIRDGKKHRVEYAWKVDKEYVQIVHNDSSASHEDILLADLKIGRER